MERSRRACECLPEAGALLAILEAGQTPCRQPVEAAAGVTGLARCEQARLQAARLDGRMHGAHLFLALVFNRSTKSSLSHALL